MVDQGPLCKKILSSNVTNVLETLTKPFDFQVYNNPC